MLVSPLVMGLVLLVDPRAKNVDISGGVAFETRGGIAPPQPSLEPEPALWISVQPSARIAYQDRVRGRELSLDYAPLAFFRLSRTLLQSTQVPGRPLLLHQATLRYEGQLSRRWSWAGSAAGSIGEQDYSLQSGGLVQGDGSDAASGVQVTQPGLLDQPIIFTGGFAGGVSATAQLTPLHSLNFGPAVTIQRLISDLPASETGTTNFDQTTYGGNVGYAAVVSPVDTLSVVATGGFADFGEVNGSQAYGSATLSWRRRLRRRLDGELAAGVFVTRQLRAPSSQAIAVDPDEDSLAIPVMPTGSAVLIGRVLERSRLRITTDVNVGSQAYFDPVRGSVLPLSGGGLGLNFELPPDLSVGITGAFFTPPTPVTEQEQRQALAVARTTLSIRTPVTYVIDRNVTMEAGTLVNARGPHLGTGIPDLDMLPDDGMGGQLTLEQAPIEDIVFEPWRFTQTEFWVYLSFRFNYTTSRSP